MTWQHDLLAGAFTSYSLDQLGQHLLSRTPLLFCTDDSAKGNKGSFSWTMGTNQDLLWGCYSTAPGWFMNSFRSERAGQLTILIFLKVYLDYHQLHDIPTPTPTFLIDSAPWLHIATNNEGLISRIQKGMATKTVFTGAVLSPEYDLVHEILSIIHHLLSHYAGSTSKDTKTNVRNGMNSPEWTPAIETLNARADYHASSGLENIHQPMKIILQIPSSQASLVMHDITITSHYATHLQGRHPSRYTATFPETLPVE